MLCLLTGKIELMISDNHDAMHKSRLDITCLDRPFVPVDEQLVLIMAGYTIDLAKSYESPG